MAKWREKITDQAGVIFHYRQSFKSTSEWKSFLTVKMEYFYGGKNKEFLKEIFKLFFLTALYKSKFKALLHQLENHFVLLLWD